jgi:hypothetical protein
VPEVTGRLRALAVDRPELEWLVLDASGATGMDSTGVHALHAIQHDLAEAGVALHLATVRGPQRDVISRAGLWTDLIEDRCHADVPAALAAVDCPPTRRCGSPGQGRPRRRPCCEALRAAIAAGVRSDDVRRAPAVRPWADIWPDNTVP